MKLFSYVTLGLLASTEASKYKVWCENGDFRARFQQQTEKKISNTKSQNWECLL